MVMPMGELINVDYVYKEIARAMIKELVEHLEGKEIKVIIDDIELTVKFNKI